VYWWRRLSELLVMNHALEQVLAEVRVQRWGFQTPKLGHVLL
jgi:hypothetical protein